jgi:hypothetical protein
VVRFLASLLAPLCANASMLVSGSFPSRLTDATLDVPTNPNSDPVPMMRVYSQGSWSGTMTVFGGVGNGYVGFEAYLMSVAFFGSPGEYVDSWSHLSATSPSVGQTSSPCSIDSQPFLPEGSSPTDGPCYVPFTFGVPQTLSFTGTSYSAYSYGFEGRPPSLAGYRLPSYIEIWPQYVETVDGSHVIFDPQANYTVVLGSVDPVPEVGSGWLGIGGLVGMSLYRRIRRG